MGRAFVLDVTQNSFYPQGTIDLRVQSVCVYRASPCLFSFQITVYLGKRDFIDHLSHIDPIGMYDLHLDDYFVILTHL